MSEFYQDMAGMVSALLAEFGAPVRITRETIGAFDPATGIITPGETQHFDLQGVIQNYTDDVIDGTRIASGDRLLVLEPGIVEPKLDDRPVIGGRAWVPVQIETVDPAGVVLAYKVRVRGIV